MAKSRPENGGTLALDAVAGGMRSCRAVKLIASGRASEIFALDDGRILRRFKAGGDPEREALVMRHAARHGYPVPEVLDVRGDALVLERIEGASMLADLRRRPWTLPRRASLLADVHKRLHEIVAPPGLAEAGGAGDRLLHLDLHPENVILSPAGPVVIDWTNARRGDPALDVALTWVIVATSGGPLGRVFVRFFLAHFELAELRRALPAAAERRIADPNVTDRERRAVRRLLQRTVSRRP
jgi:aminoglycoside phosphotransferase (APT) family kinase protein